MRPTRHALAWLGDSLLPTQVDLSSSGHDPNRRLMAAVLQTVVEDCRGSRYRQARGYSRPTGHADARNARAYVVSTDRRWPFSFENLCEALGMDAQRLRAQILCPPA